MVRVVGLGAGGHAKVVIEILRSAGGFEVAALLDPNRELWGTEVLGIPVLGSDGEIPGLLEKGVRHAFIGVGTVGDARPRRRLFEMARDRGLEIVCAVDPHAVVSPSVRMGAGATVMAGAVLNASVRLGDDVIVNTGAIVEHDCILGDHVHVATGARIAGGVRVGEGAHVGVGASVLQLIRIGRNTIVGAGAVVIRDLPDDVVAVGVPAHILRRREVP